MPRSSLMGWLGFSLLLLVLGLAFGNLILLAGCVFRPVHSAGCSLDSPPVRCAGRTRSPPNDLLDGRLHVGAAPDIGIRRHGADIGPRRPASGTGGDRRQQPAGHLEMARCQDLRPVLHINPPEPWRISPACYGMADAGASGYAAKRHARGQ